MEEQAINTMSRATSLFLPRGRLQALLDALAHAGYCCIGPQVKDGAIVYEPLADVALLPAGIRVDQAPGRYRVEITADARQFAWANGPQALKPRLFAPREVLWRAQRASDGTLHFDASQPQVKPLALIGARACDIAALALQDAHFLQGPHADPAYVARRASLFIVAVDCSHPAQTCFCVSTGDGPCATQGFDIVLSELDEGFVATAGGERGAAMLAALTLTAALPEQIDAARSQSEHAAAVQMRTLPGRDLQQALFSNLEHPRWDEVASRCLSCGNCAAVCPTCFCHVASEAPQLDGGVTEHAREWSSCFNHGHAYMHGYAVRPDTRTRYRQWLTHKLGAWHEQYGRSGCVGCGRCIAWCPVGIDITEEATAICGKHHAGQKSIK